MPNGDVIHNIVLFEMSGVTAQMMISASLAQITRPF